MKKSTVKRIQQENTRAVAESATVYSIDMDRVSIRIGSSPNVIKNVEVLGDAEALLPGAEVRIVWIDRRPVVVNGGGGGVSGVGNAGMSSLPVHGHTDADNGGALINYLSFDAHDDISLHSLGFNVPHDEHHSIGGLGDDDHMQYVHKDAARIITAKHTFNPASADVPFVLGVNSQHQLVPGFRADELGKMVFAGGGLSGGGSLVGDVTLSINESTPHTWTGVHEFTQTTVTRSITPSVGDTYDLGALDRFWRKGYISEMDSVSFLNTGATLVGGYLVIPKRSGSLSSDIGTTSPVNFDQAMTANEVVVFRSAGKYEEMLVGTLVSGTTYNVTRGYRSSGADSWPAGTPFAVLGLTGEGYIQMVAADGKPRMSVLTRGATDAEIFRAGNMEGAYGLGAGVIGLGLGEYAAGKPNLTWDPTNGLRLRNYSQDKIRLAPDGNAYIDGFLNIGAAGGIYQGTYQAGHSNDPAYPIKGVKMWNDAGIGRIGGYGDPDGDGVGSLQWYADTDGRLKAGGGNVTLDADGMTVINTTSSGEYKGINFACVQNPTLNDFPSGYISWGKSLGYASIGMGVAAGQSFGVGMSMSEAGSMDFGASSFRVSSAFGDTNMYFDVAGKFIIGGNSQIFPSNFAMSMDGSFSLTGHQDMTDQSIVPGSPSSGNSRIYSKNGVPFVKSSNGNIYALSQAAELLNALPLASIWSGSILGPTGTALAADRGGAGNHLTRSGSGNFWNWSANMGSSHLVPYVSMNGSNQYLYRAGASYLQPNGGNYQGMGGWWRFDGVNRYHSLFYFGATTPNVSMYVNNGNGIELRFWNTSGTAYTIGAGVGLTTGWHFICGYIRWDNSTTQTMKIMYDGTWYTQTTPVSPTTLRAPSGDFRIGNDGANYLYGGYSVAFTCDFTNFETLTNEYYRLTKPQYQ